MIFYYQNFAIEIFYTNRKDVNMQYEIIILELLSRIKKLEEEVSELKQVLFTPSSIQRSTENAVSGIYEENDDNSVSYKKMTDEMIDICYKSGKKLASGESVQELADDIAESTGMNRNSAIMYL